MNFSSQAVVRVQGEDVLMPVSGAEMLGSEVSEGTVRETEPGSPAYSQCHPSRRGPAGKPRWAASARSQGPVEGAGECDVLTSSLGAGRRGSGGGGCGSNWENWAKDRNGPSASRNSHGCIPFPAFSSQCENEDNPCFIVLHHESLWP